MRLIDADKLLEGEHFILKCKSEFGITEMDVFRREVIDNAPTVERPKGKWRFYGLCFSTTQYQCNKCEYLTLEKTNFCPNCGADMRGGRE